MLPYLTSSFISFHFDKQKFVLMFKKQVKIFSDTECGGEKSRG